MADGLSIDYLEDDRVTGWRDNLEKIVKTLSVAHSYENGEMTKETGPGLLVVQVADDSIAEYASVMNPNPFDEREEPFYMDDDINELYPLFEENSVEDGATVIMGNGRVLDSNVLLEPPKETYEEAESNPEYGAKHMWGARASVVPDIIYTTVLSSTSGTQTTFVDGERREAPTRRADLIEEVNEGEAEWLIDEAVDSEELEWLEPEEA
jgi:hypothetical protein